jgi:hypothetical protein
MATRPDSAAALQCRRRRLAAPIADHDAQCMAGASESPARGSGCICSAHRLLWPLNIASASTASQNCLIDDPGKPKRRDNGIRAKWFRHQALYIALVRKVRHFVDTHLRAPLVVRGVSYNRRRLSACVRMDVRAVCLISQATTGRLAPCMGSDPGAHRPKAASSFRGPL